MNHRHCGVLVVGGGPAGIAAAIAAAQVGGAGLQVCLVDDRHVPGGQIWRPGPQHRGGAAWRRLMGALARTAATVLSATSVIATLGERRLLAAGPSGTVALRWERLVLATGARELFLPFPGWTLPGVTGAGGLQALVKGGWPIRGQRVVVAGSGPLLLAAAAFAARRGAKVVRVAEQTSRARLLAFAGGLVARPGRAAQALGFAARLAGVPYTPDTWVASAEGRDRVDAVTLTGPSGNTTRVPCGALACGYGLVPNTELASALGCAVGPDGAIQVDRMQRCGTADVLAAGECTGIAGARAALLEGRVAGLTAAGRAAHTVLLRRLDSERAFGRALAAAFAPRAELRSVPEEDTFVCRCEDVASKDLRHRDGWRDAKLHTRCGMGACQGRVCGPAAAFLYGWGPEGPPRPPIIPVALGALAGAAESGSD